MSQEPIETIEYKGYKILVYPDEFTQDDPIQEDEFWQVVCWHNRYKLGNVTDFATPENFHEWLKNNPSIVLPIWGYEHGGLAIKAGVKTYPFNDLWDSGQLGYIYMTKENIRKNYQVRQISKKLIGKLHERMVDYVDYYNDYLNGAIYGYNIESPTEEVIDDSCWGFIGSNLEKSGLLESARETIDYEVGERMQSAQLLSLEPAYD